MGAFAGLILFVALNSGPRLLKLRNERTGVLSILTAACPRPLVVSSATIGLHLNGSHIFGLQSTRSWPAALLLPLLPVLLLLVLLLLHRHLQGPLSTVGLCGLLGPGAGASACAALSDLHLNK